MPESSYAPGVPLTAQIALPGDRSPVRPVTPHNKETPEERDARRKAWGERWGENGKAVRRRIEAMEG